MAEDKGKKPGPLVEDTEHVGGHDKETGQEKIGPRQSDGKADQTTESTDPRENADNGG